MNLTKNINFKNFKINKIEKKINKILTNLLIEENQIISSFKDSYTDSWNKKI